MERDPSKKATPLSPKSGHSENKSSETNVQPYPVLHSLDNIALNSSMVDSKPEQKTNVGGITREGSQTQDSPSVGDKRNRNPKDSEERNESIERPPKKPNDAEEIRKLITALINDPDDFIKKAMAFDKKFSKSPKQQLQQCLDACQGFSAEETALYLYTTYFYGPLNSYLRNIPLTEDKIPTPPMLVQLMDLTRDILINAFKKKPEDNIGIRYRIESKGGWIAGRKQNEVVPFRGFTSTHPDLHSINIMWGDMENGLFGEVKQPALLVFEGSSRILQPEVGKKYFPDEVEGILPAGMEAKVVATYTIQWKPKDKQPFDLTVFHLITPSSASKESIKKMGFDGEGNVVESSTTLFLD